MIPMTLAGLLLGALISATALRLAGAQAAVAAAAFGALALGIQVGALRLARPARDRPPRTFMARWGAGMGLRLLGIVAFALAAGLDPGHFPPVPAAAGYLGVLLPLLFFEAWLIR